MIVEFSQPVFLKDVEISNFMNIFPGMVELFHADRQTDREPDRHEGAKIYFFANFFRECA